MAGAGASPLAGMAAAADGGDAEVAHHLALMHACGLGAPHDWSAALRRLDQAAALGLDLAIQTRELLGREPDLEAWLTPPRPQRISQSPHVLTIPGFLTPEVCDWLIERARPRMTKARVYDLQSGEAIQRPERSNSATNFGLPECDLVMMLARERIARATGLPVAGLEAVHVLHYRPGEAFTPHYDFLDPDKPAYHADLRERGQRIATFLVYLNTEFEGGETEMQAIGLKHRGGKGDALFWANTLPDGRPDLNTHHAGLPPTSGEKWVYSQWCRNRAPRLGADPARSASA